MLQIKHFVARKINKNYFLEIYETPTNRQFSLDVSLRNSGFHQGIYASFSFLKWEYVIEIYDTRHKRKFPDFY